MVARQVPAQVAEGLSHNMQQALIIFVRNPVKGKVKTRIAAEAGDDLALTIYINLLKHTQAITQHLLLDVFVYYADYINTADDWQVNEANKRLQQGNTLGERMHHAFFELFAAGYQNICIIGSDCMALTEAVITTAFVHLANGKQVLGPATDGGYYLLGLTRLLPAVFMNKEWSTASVKPQTIQDFVDAKEPYILLPQLPDVDTLADCREYPQLLSPL